MANKQTNKNKVENASCSASHHEGETPKSPGRDNVDQIEFENQLAYLCKCIGKEVLFRISDDQHDHEAEYLRH